MKIGIPKEIKVHEYRVGITPAAVQELSLHHSLLIETHAGSGFSDDDYRHAGATIVNHADDIFDQAELIIKIQEPQKIEWEKLKPYHILFTYLHLASDPDQAQGLINSGASCIAYETVTSARGHLPLLTPMSEVAGRFSVQAGAHHLEKNNGGRVILLGGIPGAKAPKLVTEDMIKTMREGAVAVDIGIDQGGCFATSKATSHAKTTYIKYGVIHYCVTNIPGAVARTSSLALNHATFPYIKTLETHGLKVLQKDIHLRNGLNICRGNVTQPAVANSLNVEYQSS